MHIDFNSIFIPLSATLGLSLTVERILEFISNLWERLLGLQRTKEIPVIDEKSSMVNYLERMCARSELDLNREREAEKNEEKRKDFLKQLAVEKDKATRSQLKAQLETLEFDTAWDEKIDPSITLVEPASDPDDGKTLKRFVLQIFGFAFGIFLVHYSGIQLFSSFLRALQMTATMPVWLDFLFTGLLIGAGSAPMHTLVRFVTTRKITFAKESNSAEEKQEAKDPESKATAFLEQSSDPVVETWIDIPYFGGVDRHILEGVHLRENNPDMIIYHHTGMKSDSTFEDVVRTIKSHTDSRGNQWLTAYNCVVLYDGTIRPFCRWDRYGNHTAGFNRQSLGIALNGNFETDPKVPYSNPDGRMGASMPSEAQLKAVARVITLWLNLYEDIRLDFDKCIVPHNRLAAKSCPGNGFPYSRFQDMIYYYAELWRNSEIIQQRIAEYKFKPYIYV
jgi:hypothetical protein